MAIVLACILLLLSPHIVIKLMTKGPVFQIAKYSADGVRYTVNVVKTIHGSQRDKTVHLSKIIRKKMGSFCTTIRKLRRDSIYHLPFKSTQLKLQSKCIFSPDFGSFGLLNFLINSIPRCKIRKTLKRKSCFSVGKKLWLFLYLPFLAFIGITVALRDTYDSTEANIRKDAAIIRKLKIATTLISPEGYGYIWLVLSLPLFIVFTFFSCVCLDCYKEAITNLTLALKLTAIEENTKQFLECIFCYGTNCWCGGVKSVYSTCCGCIRCYGHGFSGCIVRLLQFILMSPFLLINMGAHLLIQMFIVVTKTSLSCVAIVFFVPVFFLHILSLFTLICAIMLMIWLFMHFLLEVLVYSLVGVILNASFTQLYIVIAISLVVYANDCFGYVAQKYRAYSRIITNAIADIALNNESQSLRVLAHIRKKYATELL